MNCISCKTFKPACYLSVREITVYCHSSRMLSYSSSICTYDGILIRYVHKCKCINAVPPSKRIRFGQDANNLHQMQIFSVNPSQCFGHQFSSFSCSGQSIVLYTVDNMEASFSVSVFDVMTNLSDPSLLLAAIAAFLSDSSFCFVWKCVCVSHDLLFKYADKHFSCHKESFYSLYPSQLTVLKDNPLPSCLPVTLSAPSSSVKNSHTDLQEESFTLYTPVISLWFRCCFLPLILPFSPCVSSLLSPLF